MQPFQTHTGIVVALDRANVDTDAIIPKQFLKKVDRVGFGKHLFHDWRYLNDEETQLNPDFVLNRQEFQGATILLARDNFGCGSSREHAPWALADYGFRVIIAPSFADIFYNNCAQNGILLVRLNAQDMDALFALAVKNPGIKITTDLANQIVLTPDGQRFSFEINPFIKSCLLSGLDHIGWTEQFQDSIQAFENKRAKEKPWL